MSLLGTAASCFGGLLIGLCAHGTPSALVLSLVCGVLGSLIDSLLGALLQRPHTHRGMGGVQWKTWNSLVNALSSSLMALCALVMEAFPLLLWPALALVGALFARLLLSRQ